MRHYYLALILSTFSWANTYALPPQPGDEDEVIDGADDFGGAFGMSLPDLIESAVFGGPGFDEDDSMLEFESALEKNDHAAVSAWLKKHKIPNFEAFKRKWRSQEDLERLDEADTDKVERFYLTLEIKQPISSFSTTETAKKVKITDEENEALRERITGSSGILKKSEADCAKEVKAVEPKSKAPKASGKKTSPKKDSK